MAAAATEMQASNAVAGSEGIQTTTDGHQNAAGWLPWLGVRLLERSTRKVRLTEVGSAYYVRCQAALDDLESADRDIAIHRSDPVGIVRVTCPTGIARRVMPRIMPGFLASYPEVRIQLQATNRAVDLTQERIDVAIRARTQLQDEALTMRKLGASSLIFVASQSFRRHARLFKRPSGSRQTAVPQFPGGAGTANVDSEGSGG